MFDGLVDLLGYKRLADLFVERLVRSHRGVTDAMVGIRGHGDLVSQEGHPTWTRC